MVTTRRLRAAAATFAAVTVAMASAIAGASGAHATTSALQPTITRLSTSHDVDWGGLNITIDGTNLTGVQYVTFGRSRGWIVANPSSTRLVVNDPGDPDGVVDVRVTTVNGTSPVTGADRLRYVPPTMSDPINGGWTTNQEVAIDARFRANAARLEAVPVAPRHAAWTVAMGQTAARRAVAWVGVPYSWAGGVPTGPTMGTCYSGDGGGGQLDCHVWGFDCSGLVLYGWGPYSNLPHFAASQTTSGRFHPTDPELEPGDLLFYAGGGSGIGHVVMYIGGGKVVQAYESGHPIMISNLSDMTRMAGRSYGAVRPTSTGVQGPAPTVTGISSSLGGAAGGQTLVVYGTGFDTTTSVLFGSAISYSYRVASPTKLLVTVPAGPEGTVHVRVGGAWGVSAPNTHDVYTRKNGPAVTGMSLASGSATGGQTVTITGQYFTADAAVTFGGVPAAAVTVVSPTQITVVTPAHAPGAVPVVVSNPFGSSQPRKYTYPLPYLGPAAPKLGLYGRGAG